MALKCPVHSVTPTRVSSPTIDLNENPELRTINAHEEDILFFGPTTITSEGSSVPNVGVVEGPQTLMETILSMELANAVTATEGKLPFFHDGWRVC